MQHKLTTQWKAGVVEIDRANGDIVIKQSGNVIRVDIATQDAFITDIDAAMQVAARIRNPTGVGYSGGMFPLAPKPHSQKPKPKNIDAIVDNLELWAQLSTRT